MTGSRSRLSTGFAGAGALAIAAYFAAGGDVSLQDAIYQAVSVAAVVGVLAGVRRNRPRDARPWLLFAAGLALWSGGDAYWNVHDWFLGRSAPFPSPADLVYLAGYPLLALGVLVLMRGWGRPALRDLLDGAVISVAATVVTWVALVGPLARGGALSAYGRAVSVADPVLDVVLLAALTQLMLRGRTANAALRLVTASIAFQLVADFVYGYLNVHDAYSNGMAVDAGWLAAYVLWGAAALHPSMRRVQSLPARAAELSRWRIATLAISLCVPTVALGLQAMQSRPVDALAIAAAALAETALVGARVLLLVREREGIRARLAVSEHRYREQLEVARRAQLELTRQNEQLQAVDQMKDDLIALVSHELRTPLTSIIGYLELVTEEDGELTEAQRQKLAIVERNAQRLIRVVSDLLLVAQAQAGRLTLFEEELELAGVVEESVAAARPAADARSIDLGLEVVGETHVVGDRQRLAQVVDNLLSNAIKFTPEGGRVSVDVSNRGDRLAVEVSDTGIGIPASDQQQLFTRFFRATAATTWAVQGTGLGLSIAKAIVDAHGGTISVASRVSEGTTFHLEIPAASSVARRELVTAA